MKSLISSDPSLLIMSGVVSFLISGIVVFLFHSLNELEKFRANLKTGDMVKVKFQQDVFRARIVSRCDEFTMIVKNIDTKEISYSAIRNIFQI